MIHRGSNDVIRTCAGLASNVNMDLKKFFLSFIQVSLPGRHMHTGLRRQVIHGLRNFCEEDAEKKVLFPAEIVPSLVVKHVLTFTKSSTMTLECYL
jgi:hypothetical protein